MSPADVRVGSGGVVQEVLFPGYTGSYQSCASQGFPCFECYPDLNHAVIALSSPNDAGFQFDTCGKNRIVPVDMDGLRLVSFGSEAALPSGLTPPELLRRRGRWKG